MEAAMIGMGKMGSAMACRLARGGHKVTVFNRTVEKARALASAESGIESVESLERIAEILGPPRSAWIMVPAGTATDEVIDALAAILAPGDRIIDGGNSHYTDTLRRGARMEKQGIHLIDAGTSGGIRGLTEGYSIMVGGAPEVVKDLRPLFETLAAGRDKGWGHVGPLGAGHFVKMIHNGIEYGLMQAYAEGFEILKAKEKEFDLDLHQISLIWRHGSVIRSWLLDLIEESLAEDRDLNNIAGWLADSGEGRWTVAEAIHDDVPAPVITLALLMRLASRREESYGAKLLAALRNRFGGHEIKKTGDRR